MAHVAGRLATGLDLESDDPDDLERGGFWVVVAEFEGLLRLARFSDVRTAPLPPAPRPWRGPAPTDWTSSLDRAAYTAGVEAVRERVASGDVYQVNLCRVLEAPLSADDDLLALAHVVATGNPAPYAAFVRLPGLEVVCASPERYLRRDGDRVASSPIKGTGRTAADLTPKDEAENVMIVDLVRNDLGHLARTGTVAVERFLHVEQHPGLVHLVSTVSATLRRGTGWRELLEASFPPGSVSGAPKSSALRAIAALEPVPRGPYCGAVGWVDADAGTAELAVGIRTFWATDGVLRFGTGAGITWGSDADAEWRETELKAARLVGLASCAPG